MSDVLISGRGHQNVLARLVLFCTAYTAGAALLDPVLYSRNFAKYLPIFLGTVPIFCAIGLLSAGILCRPRSPLTFIHDVLKERGITALAVGAGCWAGMAAFWTYKFHIPQLVPFYADQTLADIDEAIHFGTPWRFLHEVVPETALPTMTFIYFPIWLCQFIGTMTFAAFHSNSKNRARYLVSFAAMIAGLGTFLAGALSSVGPIFYDRFLGGSRFSDLTHALHGNADAAVIVQISERLYSAYVTGTGGLVAGISAMPSIHVAVPALNTLFLLKVNRWLGVVSCAFTAAIMFESVYFGWHYALDGYVSVVAVLLIWHFAGSVTDEQYEHSRSVRGTWHVAEGPGYGKASLLRNDLHQS